MSTHALANFKKINDIVKELSNKANIIAVTKTFPLEAVSSLISYGHLHYGENKVLEAINKWSNLLKVNKAVQLHLIGHLQSNKAKEAVSVFSYIHSLDSEKLANILSKEEKNANKKIKYFIQVNLGGEKQKFGILVNLVDDFIKYTKNDLGLDVIGLMCIPPADHDPNPYFLSLKKIADSNELSELSMGMSNDYKDAINHGATFIRIGSAIFGQRI
jgi:pyridoxal phosphate enzyme (YggS family)